MSKGPPPIPEILLEKGERSLRLILRALIAAHPVKGVSNEARLRQALAALLGRPMLNGRSPEWRDELLEMMAFDYSVKTKNGRTDVSYTSIAEELVKFHPSMANLSGKDSIVRDLVRKFEAYKEHLLAAHAYDGNENFAGFYFPVADALHAMRAAGIEVSSDMEPPKLEVAMSRLTGPESPNPEKLLTIQ